jgi:putative Mg2+ transporter-C (MgtC) family protein
LSVIFGAVIGLERELAAQPAGLRTHILVALGAALFTLVGTRWRVSTEEFDYGAGISLGLRL